MALVTVKTKYQVTLPTRINQGWRFYFQIEGDFYVILALIAHRK